MYYYPLSDLAIVPLADGKVLFKSDTLAIRIDGRSVTFLLDSVFPLLNGDNDLQKVAGETGLTESELAKSLDELVSHGVLIKGIKPKKNDISAPFSPIFGNFLDKLGMLQEETQEYLAKKKITIVGLDGIGFYLLQMLAAYGITLFNIADCTPVGKSDLSLFDFLTIKDLGQKRQDIIKTHFKTRIPHLKIETLGEINKEHLENFAHDSHLIIGCFDKSFMASNYWINEISHSLQIPALFAEINGSKSFVGPLVIPDQTACFMCYKMRGIACDKNYEEVMSYEEHLNAQKKSRIFDRGFLPSNLQLTASLIAGETIKFLLGLDLNSVKGKVLEFDVFNLKSENHTILFKADCPVCRKKKECGKTQYDIKALLEKNKIEGDLSAYEKILVSKRTGIISYYDLFKKDISEPTLPFIFRADLANHNFVSDPEGGHAVCSGKGLTLAEAKTSALGEAVERYSGAVYDASEIEYLRFEDIHSKKLHPKDLVLFEDFQYAGLEFSKFRENEKIGWANAYSLVSEKSIKVPAISVFMDYKIHDPAEYLFPVTSNGLGAGATLLQAILSASMEVVERDAFIITWHQKLKCTRYDPLSLPMPDVVDYCRSYGRRGVVLNLFKLPSDFPCHIFMSVAEQVEGDGPAIVVGLGADFDPLKAARGALIEVGQVRPGLMKRLHRPETTKRLEEILDDPAQVKELEDHDLLYASPASKYHFDFLLKRPAQLFDLEENPLTEGEKIKRLIDHLKDIGSDLIYYNLTPPEMEALHLFTARAIIPHLQPIHFGSQKIRLGGKRLYELPHRLKLKNKVTSYGDIDLQPHPLA